jgi:hypothetical protein
LENKKYIVSHGGTTYREKPILVGNYFNQFVNKTLIQCPDLLDLYKNKNEELINVLVDPGAFMGTIGFLLLIGIFLFFSISFF